MREIVFRGQRIDNGKWVYGHYNCNPFMKRAEIFSCDSVMMYVHEVKPETVGQFTGLHDKEGKPIYEGDLLRSEANSSRGIWVCYWNGKEGEFTVSQFPIPAKYASKFKTNGLGKRYVIGNIHDEHAHLLEV